MASDDRASARAGLLTFGAAVGVLAAFVLLWRFTPLSEYATPEAANTVFGNYRFDPLAPVFTTLIFVLGGLIAFPVTIMIVAVTATFGLWPGALYAAIGSLASAAVGYGVGHGVGAARINRLLGPRAQKITKGIGRQGVLVITTIRIVPIAPFSIVNLVAGALDIKFVDFMVGTALGLAPGFVVLSVAGDQVSSFVAHPTIVGGLVLALVLVAWIALSFALQAVVRRRARA